MSNRKDDGSLFGVILAGGSGTRFWPLSRSQYPKQVLKLLGSESLIETTVKRVLPRIPLNRLAVVTNTSQADIIRIQLYRQNWEEIKLWLEPQGRNTAAAVGLAAVLLDKEGSDVVMAVFPADHFILQPERLLEALDRGMTLAQDGYLVTFGIPPSRPDTGFGYIRRGESLDPQGRSFQCAAFVEKPDLPRAQNFLQSGEYYWNSGIFMFRRDILLSCFSRYLPELYQGLTRLLEDSGPSRLAEVYESLPSISLDYGILERAERVAVVPVEMGWNDVGTWGALYDLFPRNEQGNIILGRALDLNSRDCLIYTQNRLVATVGLEGVVVVDTPDATLVCKREKVQEVKGVVEELHRRKMVESELHPTVERPWGHYTVMDAGPNYKIKQIVVDVGKRLSLQLHQHRAEHWVVVQGTAQVTIGRETRLVRADESVFVPAKTPHRLANPGPEAVRIIEIQTGPYLEEDDIVRLEDDYWRLPEAGTETAGGVDSR